MAEPSLTFLRLQPWGPTPLKMCICLPPGEDAPLLFLEAAPCPSVLPCWTPDTRQVPEGSVLGPRLVSDSPPQGPHPFSGLRWHLSVSHTGSVSQPRPRPEVQDGGSGRLLHFPGDVTRSTADVLIIPANLLLPHRLRLRTRKLQPSGGGGQDLHVHLDISPFHAHLI